tara:strand:- start:1593 stop:2027 length:435 start_codon:yes stop_codon:yes gene_type:complete
MIFTWSGIVIIAFLIGLYFIYVGPKVQLIKRIKNDSTLHELISRIDNADEHDPRSVRKMKSSIQTFFLQHGKSYSNIGSARELIAKLDKSLNTTMKYARRIPLRLPNDGHLERDVVNAIDNLEKILKNYISDAANRSDIKWFPK